MLKRLLQCLCQTQLNAQIRIFKRDHCSFHIDHEMSFEIKHTTKHNFRLKLGKS